MRNMMRRCPAETRCTHHIDELVAVMFAAQHVLYVRCDGCAQDVPDAVPLNDEPILFLITTAQHCDWFHHHDIMITRSDCYDVVTGSLLEFLRACWDCSASHVDLVARAEQATDGYTVEGPLAGFLQHRLDNDGEPALSPTAA